MIYPEFNPIAFEIGPVQVRWYGLMYLLGFLVGWLGARHRAKRPLSPVTPVQVDDLIFYTAFGVIAGGRIGYCLFYKPAYYLAHPLEIFAVWQGGMSFHGGLIGVLLAMVWFARSRQRPWLQVMDLIAPCVPTGLAAGRLGNFINGELWGRVAGSDLPWGMVFPGAGSAPRHPSQLYQFLLEGFLLFVLLWLYARHPRKSGQVSAVFLMGYGVLRFVAEFFREPDDHLGLLALSMSMGQWLCVPMIAAGLLLWLWSSRKTRHKLRAK